MPKIQSTKPPRERILETSQKLFHEEGYRATGINLILEESNCAKASLYEHFSSKEKLATAVARRYEAGILLWQKSILNRSQTPISFAGNLQKAVLKQIKAKEEFHRGCPIALFSIHFQDEKNILRKEFRNYSLHWEELLIKKINVWKAQSLIDASKNSRSMARFILNVYEGALTMWRISGDETYLVELKPQLKKIFE